MNTEPRRSCDHPALVDDLCPACWIAINQPRPRRTYTHLEDVLWMRDTGETFLGAARRLNLDPESLATYLRRRGLTWTPVTIAPERTAA